MYVNVHSTRALEFVHIDVVVHFLSQFSWSATQRVNLFRKELCRKLLPSLYRDSRPGFKMSLFRSRS